jgi:predicted flap endonuclease-1-like 5' DNA nuclease
MTLIVPETAELSKAAFPFTALTSIDFLESHPLAVSPAVMVERFSDLQLSLFKNTMRLWLAPFGYSPEAAPKAAEPLPEPAAITPAFEPAKVVTLQPRPAPAVVVEAPLAVALIAPVPTPAPAVEAAFGEKAPALLLQPKGEPDDLERIVGIGPKLKKTLNDLGVWHFRQIAAWSPEEVSWVNTRTAFKGRIEREGWQKQASRLSRSADKAA